MDPEDGSIDTLGSMDVVVSFNPDSAGDYAGELVIESNDSDEGTLTLILITISKILEFMQNSMKLCDAVIGPIVCELDGPTPILNISNILNFMSN